MIDISIVIPTYDNLNLLKKALFSVINQQNIEIEVIIVDDSTNSEIFDFVRKLNSDRIRYRRNIPSKGAVRNWNYGLTLAKGSYVTILHHDEYYEDSVNQLFNLITNHSDKEILISKIIVIKPDNSTYTLRLNGYLKNLIANFFPSYLFFHNFIGPVSCVVFKNNNSNVFFNENLKWYVDVDWYFRLFKNKRIKYFSNYSILSNLSHDGKITKNIDIKKEIRKDFKFLYDNYKNSPVVMLFINSNIFLRKIKSIFNK